MRLQLTYHQENLLLGNLFVYIAVIMYIVHIYYIGFIASTMVFQNETCNYKTLLFSENITFGKLFLLVLSFMNTKNSKRI